MPATAERPLWAEHHAPAVVEKHDADEQLITELVPVAIELATICDRHGVRPPQLRGYAVKVHNITGAGRTAERMETLCQRALLRAGLRKRHSGRRVAFYSPSLFT